MHLYHMWNDKTPRGRPLREERWRGKRNLLGRVYESGKALSEPSRENKIELYKEGFSVTEISNVVRVTVRGVNKIINHYAHQRTCRPLIRFCRGRSEADVVT